MGITSNPTVNSSRLIALEDQYGAYNYAPVKVVAAIGKGVAIFDADGNRYVDLMGGYSVANHGHCHDKIVAAAKAQLDRLTLISRAFYSDKLGPFEQLLCETFQYERALLMNTGVEAFETALKLARRWGYATKGIAPNLAHVLFANNNFHGRSIAAISASTDPKSFGGFGPLLPEISKIPFNDIPALEHALQSNPNIAAFFIEPIQGEAGVVVPASGYLSAVSALCRQYNVLFIVDEVQTGMGRTGKLLCVDHDYVKPDVVLLGKSLGGGIVPVSAILTSDDIIKVIRPGEHGSTFGGNPMSSACGSAAIEVLVDEQEDLIGNAARMGEIFLQGIRQVKSPFITDVRGKGLLIAFDVKPIANEDGRDVAAPFWKKTAANVEASMIAKGFLVRCTHSHTIRLAPPLMIDEATVKDALQAIQESMQEYEQI
uniref:Ornithine aminotransferase n=1 Tax=Spongospora subterranea TaxID=70186 RepID=A0A0H5R4Q3_9EUKA|eukprot:CRZ09180.1 hypothetical protein [Spongospora subterranea]